MIRLVLVEGGETICYMYDFNEAVKFAEKLIRNGSKTIEIYSIAPNNARVRLRRIP